MARRKIPREPQDIAALLKHPGIDQQAKQQIIDQLTPEERQILGCAPPKPAPRIEPTRELAPRQGPAPLKLVTSWPVQVQELELPLPEERKLVVRPPPADVSLLEPMAELSATWRWAAVLASGAAILWPVIVIVGCILLLVTVGYQVSAACH